LVGVKANSNREAFHIYMIMHIRLDLVFDIQEHIIDVDARRRIMHASILLLERGIQAT